MCSLLTPDEPAKAKMDSKTVTDVDDGTSGGNNTFSCKRGKLCQDDVAFLLWGYFDTSDCEVVVPSPGA